MQRAFLMTLLLVSFPSSAGSLEYVCTVKSELSVGDGGLLKPHKNPIEVGRIFVIDRTTGKILGRPFRNSTASEVRVLNRGGSKHSFEVLSVSSPTGKVTTDLVAVHEYVRNEEKPFIGVESGLGTVYSGTCK